MRPILILLPIVLSGSLAHAQRVVDLTNDDYKVTAYGTASTAVNGMIYSPVKFVKVTDGTPFFRQEWMKGSVIVDGGRMYSDLELRLNLVDNEVNYKDSTGQEMVAASPLSYVALTDLKGTKYEFVKGSQLKNIDKTLTNVWFQLLVNDKKASLVKQIKKSIRETIAYGTATTEQQIVSIEYYFLQINGGFARFKWDDWQDQFKDKKDEISQFIKNNHLKGKNSDDYVKLVKYYNSL